MGAGLGATTSVGSIGLIPPTLEITHTGQEEVLDGVRIQFQMTPGTECPVEMNFFFPERRALCMAENATHNLHNLLTLRGAVVRDPRIWARYLNEAVNLFCNDADVAFASHHWPMWGRDRIVTYLRQQRDLYTYLHDQTLRLMNHGYTGMEIAEMMEMPPALEAAWHTHGYYGSVSHNVKAIYQRYLGWFDGNPSSLWEHPPVEAATRYVECMGGTDEVVTKARRYADDGDLRFAAQLLKHAVFADATHAEAKALLGDVYERLGFGAENGTWRNFYLQGAAELRTGRRWPARQPHLTGDGRSSRHRPALRHHRHPNQWAKMLERELCHRLGLHRSGPHLPDDAVERGSDSGRRSSVGERRRDADVDVDQAVVPPNARGGRAGRHHHGRRHVAHGAPAVLPR